MDLTCFAVDNEEFFAMHGRYRAARKILDDTWQALKHVVISASFSSGDAREAVRADRRPRRHPDQHRQGVRRHRPQASPRRRGWVGRRRERRERRRWGGDRSGGAGGVILVGRGCMGAVGLKYCISEIAVIETKHFKADDIKNLVEERANSFRAVFPYYKDYKIYLGLGAISFDDDVIEAARKYGVGLIKQVEDAVEDVTDGRSRRTKPRSPPAAPFAVGGDQRGYAVIIGCRVGRAWRLNQSEFYQRGLSYEYHETAVAGACVCGGNGGRGGLRVGVRGGRRRRDEAGYARRRRWPARLRR